MSEELMEYEGFSFGNEPEKPFTLHQEYEEKGSTKQVKCAKCGRTALEVGCGSYFAVLRCPDCGHEHCLCSG